MKTIFSYGLGPAQRNNELYLQAVDFNPTIASLLAPHDFISFVKVANKDSY
jgi:hypothetical protein